jgi:hypothetical protein
MTMKSTLESLFDARRRALEAEDALVGAQDRAGLVKLLAGAVEEAHALGDVDESRLRLEALADLCSRVDEPHCIPTLIQILNHEDPIVREAAGEALLARAYDRYVEVARAIEAALEANLRGPAMLELPWLITEVGEPSALALVKRFLAHPDAEVVAASIEAPVTLGDPRAIPHLEPLSSDPRPVTIEGYEAETSATLGELAQEAIEELSADEE